jgi:enoyl-CoA hydratase/carnithine racemase
MDDVLVHVERRSDGVAVLRLSNGKVNALSSEMLRQIESAARALTEDPPGAVVVTGGDRVFAAGANILEFGGQAEAETLGRWFFRALNAVADIPRVTIAAVAGVALGGGCELAMACDLRIASEKAKFGQPEVLLGIIPGGGGTQRLPRLVGPARAKELIYSGRNVEAEEALRIGLIDRVAPADSLEAEALAWAGTFATGPVLAHALMKRAIDRGLDSPLPAGLELEQQLFVEAFGTDDARVGVESFKAAGPGKATFSGR